MTKYKLASILLETTPQFFKATPSYCAANAPIIPTNDQQNTWLLSGPGSFDFTTYFNALPTIKWLRYTNAKDFFLHLELKGKECTFFQTRGDTFTWDAEKLDDTAKTIAESDDWTVLDIPLQLNFQDVVIGFILEASGELYIRNSYYYTELAAEDINDVELALCTTTFKNEDYILPNINLIKERILKSDEPIASHFTLHVVDNGNTLDPKDIETDHVHVHPNPNAGGAGGFARGMIEALEQEPKATHVLLMDDDVNVSAESIIRSYALLAILNEEYSEAFLSGAMMDLDVPNHCYEDVGFVAEEGKYFPVKYGSNANVLHDCIIREAYRKPNPDEPFKADRATQAYAAWWYCVIPTTVIERVGLPLPIFVRTDDVEYSLRAKPKFMTMNGICVWHAPFHKRYSAPVERYQMTRNVLIGQFATDIAPRSDFLGSMKRAFELELKKFCYPSAELILDAFEDFLKGPSFIAEPGMAEKTYLSHLKSAEKLVPLEELREQAQEIGVNIDDINTLLLYDDGFDDDHRNFVSRLQDYTSVNGHRRFKEKYTEPGSVCVISTAGWLYPADKIRKKEYLIAIDPVTKKGVIRKIDRERFKALNDRFHRDMLTYRTEKDRLKKEYVEARDTIVSIPFWKNYLGIE